MKPYEIKSCVAYRMLCICLIIVLLAHSSIVSAQTSEGGVPPSFLSQQTLRSASVATDVPVDFYIEDLIEVDNWQARIGVPMPVSKLIPVDYSTENSGYHTTLPGGENIWRLHLKASGALAIMLYYDRFYIPEGGRLFIYSADRSHVLGAYTHLTNPSGGLFATEFVGGDDIVLEYVAPEADSDKPRIHISEVGYGYNSSALQEFCGITTRSTGVSGPCMVNINCEEGDAWQSEKKSVCYTVQRIGRKSYMCTGSLMNNTAEDFKPLILTARHCAYDGSIIASASDMEQWAFYFHREREGCNNNSVTSVSKTMIGCKLLVNTELSGQSDGMLVLLNNVIPEDYDVFYNGWDRRDVASTSGVCIHHPSGDYMKISTYGRPANETTFRSSEATGGRMAHWNIVFQKTANGHAVTEKGSSGSPLYNEKKLVVGTLTGGNSSCSDLPEGVNLYGKMSYHWNVYQKDSSTRMDVWLDPLDSRAETLEGRFRRTKPSPRNLIATNIGHGISLTWSAPSGADAPKLYSIYRNNKKIGESTFRAFLDTEPTSGASVYSVSAVYEDKLESAFAVVTMFYIEYKAPSNLKAERFDAANEIKLSWNAPAYEQTIYWGTMFPLYKAGYDNNKEFYFGQKWSSGDIAPLNKKTITAVQFFPTSGNSYEVFILQGSGYSYRQKIDDSSLTYQSLNTIKLETPFVIDASNSLTVSIYTSKAGNNYSAICDGGPVVYGKGNVVSFDGVEWGQYDSQLASSGYNFVVSAVISSESGELPSGSNIVRNAEVRKEVELAGLRTEEMLLNDNPVSLYSSQPVSFPEVVEYRVYRSGSVHQRVAASATVFSERNPLDSHFYEVSALYSGGESERSNKASIVRVGLENINSLVDIYPTKFSNYVNLKEYDSVMRLEIISVSGKVCLVVDRPNGVIDTSSLPSGFYFFRIYGNGFQKTIRAVKAN